MKPWLTVAALVIIALYVLVATRGDAEEAVRRETTELLRTHGADERDVARFWAAKPPTAVPSWLLGAAILAAAWLLWHLKESLAASGQ